MKTLALLLLLELLFGCFHRGTFVPPARAGDPGAKVVREPWQPRPDEWRNSPWYLPDWDVTTPMRVIIAQDGYACVLGFTTDDPRPQDYYVCQTGWRRPRVR